jgi:hypothetical protein
MTTARRRKCRHIYRFVGEDGSVFRLLLWRCSECGGMCVRDHDWLLTRGKYQRRIERRRKEGSCTSSSTS